MLMKKLLFCTSLLSFSAFYGATEVISNFNDMQRMVTAIMLMHQPLWQALQEQQTAEQIQNNIENFQKKTEKSYLSTLKVHVELLKTFDKALRRMENRTAPMESLALLVHKAVEQLETLSAYVNSLTIAIKNQPRRRLFSI